MSRMGDIIARSLRERPEDWELLGGGYYLAHKPSNAALWVNNGPDHLRSACNYGYDVPWPALGYWDRRKVWKAYLEWRKAQPTTFDESKFGLNDIPWPIPSKHTR